MYSYIPKQLGVAVSRFALHCFSQFVPHAVRVVPVLASWCMTSARHIARKPNGSSQSACTSHIRLHGRCVRNAVFVVCGVQVTGDAKITQPEQNGWRRNFVLHALQLTYWKPITLRYVPKAIYDDIVDSILLLFLFCTRPHKFPVLISLRSPSVSVRVMLQPWLRDALRSRNNVKAQAENALNHVACIIHAQRESNELEGPEAHPTGPIECIYSVLEGSHDL